MTDLSYVNSSWVVKFITTGISFKFISILGIERRVFLTKFVETFRTNYIQIVSMFTIILVKIV